MKATVARSGYSRVHQHDRKSRHYNAMAKILPAQISKGNDRPSLVLGRNRVGPSGFSSFFTLDLNKDHIKQVDHNRLLKS